MADLTRIKTEDDLAAAEKAKPAHELPVSFARCPRCGCEFEDIRIISMDQLAANLLVSLSTIRSWVRRDLLQCRLWARNRRIHRVFLASDVRVFLDRVIHKPGDNPDSYASKLYADAVRNGRKGQKIRAEKDALRRAAKLSSDNTELSVANQGNEPSISQDGINVPVINDGVQNGAE